MSWDKYLEAAKEAAWRAGRMLKKNIDASREVSFKGVIDLVTNFDNQSQRMILKRLSAIFPDHGFLAEEGLSETKGSEFQWIIDPLDGTTNYAHRFPVFTVSIALEAKGEVVVGVVYDPMREETFWAAKGEGAFLNGRKIRVSSIDDLNKGLLATGFPYDIRVSETNNIVHFNNFLTRAQALRRCGSAAMDLCYVACGRFDGFWELKLKPWDMAAGALMVHEAGGRVSGFQNEKFSLSRSNILASNGLIHQQMIGVLNLGKGSG
jgi:myo-inositol-1(or 4)-monophosphatase